MKEIINIKNQGLSPLPLAYYASHFWTK